MALNQAGNPVRFLSKHTVRAPVSLACLVPEFLTVPEVRLRQDRPRGTEHQAIVDHESHSGFGRDAGRYDEPLRQPMRCKKPKSDECAIAQRVDDAAAVINVEAARFVEERNDERDVLDYFPYATACHNHKEAPVRREVRVDRAE